MKWWEGRLVGFDTETTDKSPLTARIITASIAHVQPDARPSVITWVIDSGCEVPEEASAVNGWTTEKIAAFLDGAPAIRIHGGVRMPMAVDGALGEIAGHLAVAMHTDTPVVVHNAAYDLTLLEQELARNSIDLLTARPTGIRGVVDTMVLEKQYDPYRKVKDGCRGGKYRCGGCGRTDKTLGSLCAHYGLVLPGAHRASVDAVAACRLAVKLMGLWPDVARLKLATLHNHQVTWRREQSDSLREFWRRRDDPRWSEVDSGWPVHSALADGLVGVVA